MIDQNSVLMDGCVESAAQEPSGGEYKLPDHSELGASGADRWMNCHGSVALIKKWGLPESDSPEFRTLGSAGHWVLERCLRNDEDAWEYIGTKVPVKVGKDEHGVDVFIDVPVDSNMANAIQVFIDNVRPLMRLPGAKTFIEYRMWHPDFHPKFFGTIDCGIIIGPKLVVRDYKHGEGIPVDVEENPQIMYYAYGLVRDHPEITTVDLGIIQPRIHRDEGPIQTWDITAADLVKWAETDLKPHMLATEFDHDLNPGAWCRFCPAKLACGALNSLFGAAMLANPDKIGDMSDEGLGKSYKYVEPVKYFLKALGEEVLRRKLLGKAIENAKLVPKKANRVFQSTVTEKAGELEWERPIEDALRDKFGGEAFTEPKVKTPAQIEALGAEAKKFVKEYAYTPQTGYTIASPDDRRTEIIVQKASETFAHYAHYLGDEKE